MDNEQFTMNNLQFTIYNLYSNSVYGQKGYCTLVLHFAGRLKSPAIDIDHENPSIGGDFNRPSDVKPMHEYLF